MSLRQDAGLADRASASGHTLSTGTQSVACQQDMWHCSGWRRMLAGSSSTRVGARVIVVIKVQALEASSTRRPSVFRWSGCPAQAGCAGSTWLLMAASGCWRMPSLPSRLPSEIPATFRSLSGEPDQGRGAAYCSALEHPGGDVLPVGSTGEHRASCCLHLRRGGAALAGAMIVDVLRFASSAGLPGFAAWLDRGTRAAACRQLAGRGWSGCYR